jgi:hypothetical protein
MSNRAPTAHATPVTPSADQRSRARLQAKHKHLVLRQCYYTTLRFILNRRIDDLKHLALQRQTCNVIAIKNTKIWETYNEAVLLREHFNRSANKQLFHALYGLLLHLKLRCLANTPALTPEQINGGWPSSPSQSWIDVHAIIHNTGDRRLCLVPGNNKLRWTILNIE